MDTKSPIIKYTLLLFIVFVIMMIRIAGPGDMNQFGPISQVFSYWIFGGKCYFWEGGIYAARVEVKKWIFKYTSVNC